MNGNGNIVNTGGGANSVPPPQSLAEMRKDRLRRALNNSTFYKNDYLVGELSKDYVIAQYGSRKRLVRVMFRDWTQSLARHITGSVYWWWMDLRGVTEIRLDNGLECRHRVGCTKSYFDADDNCMNDLFLTFVKEKKTNAVREED